MTAQETITIVASAITLIAVIGGSIIVLKAKNTETTNDTKSKNIKDLMDRVLILEKEIEVQRKERDTERQTAHDLHTANAKAIANLEGQLKTYKDIPLTQIATSLGKLDNLAETNQKILDTLTNSATLLADNTTKQVTAVEHVKEDLSKKGGTDYISTMPKSNGQ